MLTVEISSKSNAQYAKRRFVKATQATASSMSLANWSEFVCALSVMCFFVWDNELDDACARDSAAQHIVWC